MMNEEMKKAMAGKAMPELAIVDNNTLAALGLKGLLESAVPMVKISIFGTFGEFESNAPERFMHYSPARPSLRQGEERQFPAQRAELARVAHRMAKIQGMVCGKVPHPIPVNR